MVFAVSCYYSGTMQFVHRDEFHLTTRDGYCDCVCVCVCVQLGVWGGGGEGTGGGRGVWFVLSLPEEVDLCVGSQDA